MSPIIADPEEGKGGHSPDPTETATPPLDSAPQYEVSTPPTIATAGDEAPTVPAPTKVDAYKPRGYGSSKQWQPVVIADLMLRLLTAVFALIAFAVIASDDITLYTSDGVFEYSATLQFQDFFFFSYLLTANVIACVYAIATLILGVVLLNMGKSFEQLPYLITVFTFDQIFSYILMSAATSAATGTRAEKNALQNIITFPPNVFDKPYASAAFGFLAFFTLAASTILSGYRIAHKGFNF